MGPDRTRLGTLRLTPLRAIALAAGLSLLAAWPVQAALDAHAPAGLRVKHRAFDDETHATACHAAALDAFRHAFAPVAKPAGR